MMRGMRTGAAFVAGAGMLAVLAVLAALAVVPDAHAAVPANDDFANALALPLDVDFTDDNTGATEEAGEPSNDPDCSMDNTIWYRLDATTDGIATVTGSPLYPTWPAIFSVYEGSSLTALTREGCNDNGYNRSSSRNPTLRFPVSAGHTYWLQVGAEGLSEWGQLRMHASVTANTPPANDSYAAAAVISGVSGALDADNAHATRELGEPIAHNNWIAGGHSVWYRWTAPADGDYRFATRPVAVSGAAHDTLVRIFHGDDLGAATLVAENDDIGPDDYLSTVTFQAVAGVEYHVAVDAWDYIQASGAFDLVWDQPPPTPDPSPTIANRTIRGSVARASGPRIGLRLTGTNLSRVPIRIDLPAGLQLFRYWGPGVTCSGVPLVCKSTSAEPDVHVILTPRRVGPFSVTASVPVQYGESPVDNTVTVRMTPRLICDRMGTPGPDRFVGSSAGDILCGFGGNDRLRGRGGADILFGGRGADLLVGGHGADRLYGGRGRDTCRDAADLRASC